MELLKVLQSFKRFSVSLDCWNHSSIDLFCIGVSFLLLDYNTPTLAAIADSVGRITDVLN